MSDLGATDLRKQTACSTTGIELALLALLFAGLAAISGCVPRGEPIGDAQGVLIEARTEPGLIDQLTAKTQLAVADFTLFADGRLIVKRQGNGTGSPPAPELLEAKLEPTQVSALTGFLADEGFFELDRRYEHLRKGLGGVAVADAATRVITARSGSESKTVGAYGLEIAVSQGDRIGSRLANEYRTIERIWSRLQGYEPTGGLQPFTPRAGALIAERVPEGQGGLPPVQWEVELDLREVAVDLGEELREERLDGKTFAQAWDAVGLQVAFVEHEGAVYRVALRPDVG